MTRTNQQRRTLGAAVACAGLLLAGCSANAEPTAPTPSPSVTSASSATSATSATSASSTPSASPAPSTATPSASPSVETPSATPSVTVAAAPTVGEVYRDARTASLSAGSGHVAGTQTRDGRTLRIDVEGVANGSNQTVSIATPSGGTAEVLTVGGRYWLGGDEAFWVEQTGDAASGKGMVGKYVEVNESDATELGSFTLRSILTEKFGLPQYAALEGSGAAAERTTVKGTDAFLLRGRDGAKLWVAADGSGTLLRAVGPRGAPSDLTFSAWERAQTFAPPPASAIVTDG